MIFDRNFIIWWTNFYMFWFL